MRHLVTASVGKGPGIVLALSVGIAACSGGSTTPAPAGGGANASATGGGGGGGGASAAAGGGVGTTNVTGSIVSSGGYAATWTWQAGNAADVGTGGVTLNSDKGTFGSLSVLADGSITFTSGAPELKAGSYKGTGAQVHMKEAGGAQLPCGWTLDNDVTGSDGVVIHLKGTMDIIGSVWECPG